jgi:hypothetical protein
MAALCAVAVIACLSGGAGAGSIHHAEKLGEISPAAALSFYERMVILRDAAPAKFDQVHPLAGRLLASETVYEELLKRWEAHPARFEHNHECVWRLLYGDLIHHKLHAPHPTTGQPVPPYNTITVTDNNPPGPGTPSGDNPSNPPPGGVTGSSVPEPSAGALMASGLVLVALAAARHRAMKRWKPRQSAEWL